MENNHPVTISQKEDKNINSTVFDIYFGHRKDDGLGGGTYSLRGFNEDNHLKKFITYFKDKEITCWLLFYTYIGYSERSLIMEENIKKVLSFSPDTLTLQPSLVPLMKPKNWFKRIFFSNNRPLFPTYVINFNENCFSHFQEIFNYIDSGTETECYFIFGNLTDKDSLFSKLENLYKENSINKKGIYSVSHEFIELGLGCCGAEDTFQIVTSGFRLSEIKDMFLKSSETDKFDIVIK